MNYYCKGFKSEIKLKLKRFIESIDLNNLIWNFIELNNCFYKY